ncbi:L-threonine 3-dehydrogenase [Acidaminobacter sp. JC074]|uniref:L-threonine 3-dehydrogenase n=1 Tax=Acidaminobacter sp. JC074 TaxID=2530199 RepID=UPI001F0E4F7E|nr:L-threonine 3-dehydrogenase [Acidaminobacter sp. JC074]MCH4889788.1 L-threonine 3-dehydrogenase [Acidaminobacter sp. JC074]
MKKILVTGATGQIGTELVMKLRQIYGNDNVIASNIRDHLDSPIRNTGPFELLDVRDQVRFFEVATKYHVDTIIHLAAFLSATAEKKPLMAWDLNMGGLLNGLEVARELKCQFFTPSSIGAFGPSTIKDNTPQEVIQRPNTMYGINKVAGELLCDYYHEKYGVDTRGLRFPGLISYMAMPGGGTTDYAVHIFYEALKNKSFECYLEENTYMDMMYMPDAINSVIKLMEADPDKLVHRNAYNVSAMSFSPKEIEAEIQKYIPDFLMTYKVDPMRQKIADSWPNSIDSQAAIDEWQFRPVYDLEMMVKDMLNKVKV